MLGLKCTMGCLHCKEAESLQILSGLPLLHNVRLVPVQIVMYFLSSNLQKTLFLTRLKLEGFLWH